jgi:hypothetical protein
MCASPQHTSATPMYALFSMQLAVIRMREQCLSDMSTELAMVKDSVLSIAAQHMTDKKKVGTLLHTISLLLNKVCVALTTNC